MGKKTPTVQKATTQKNNLDKLAQAEEAYIKYDISQAIMLFDSLAKQGNGRSCYFLGQIYEYGYNGCVHIDKDKAIKYRKQGAEAGDLLCSMKLAESACNEQEKNDIYARTYKAVTVLAEQGDIFAMFELGRLYAFAWNSIQDDRNAIYWYNLSAESGFWCAYNNLGIVYIKQHDYNKGLACYQKAVDCGYELAMSNLAYAYYLGIVVPKNNDKATELALIAAEKGSASAQFLLGKIAFENYQYDKAKIWMLKAANNGDEDALLFMVRYFSDESNDEQVSESNSYLSKVENVVDKVGSVLNYMAERGRKITAEAQKNYERKNKR